MPPVRDDNRKPFVAFRSFLFRPSETFVHSPLEHFQRWRPILTGWDSDPDALGARAAGAVVYSRIASSPLHTRLRYRFGYYPPQAFIQLAQRRPRLCHAHFGDDGAIALNLCQALAIPSIVTFYGHDVTRLPTWRTWRPAWIYYAYRFRDLKSRTSMALAYCEFLRNRLIALGWEKSRVRLHYTGTPIPHEPMWRGESDAILAVGRLVEKKGFDTLLHALAHLGRTTKKLPTLVIVGDGPLRTALERLAGVLGVWEAVRFVGWLKPGQLEEYFARAALVCAPSRRARDGDMEGLPTVLVESAARGLPLVGSDHAGIPEIVRDNRTGILVPEGDPVRLAEAIGQMLGDTELRGRLAQGARAVALAQFDIRRQTERLEELYDEVTAVR